MKIVILARKNLQYNTRVERQARALIQAGHTVEVVTLKVENPLPSLTQGDYNIIRLELSFFDRQTQRQIISTPFRVIQKSISVVGKIFGKKGKPMADNPATVSTQLHSSPSTGSLFTERSVEILRKIFRPLANPFKTFSFTYKSYQAMKTHPADVYQAHDSQALLAAYLLARKHRGRFVYDAVEIVTDRSGSQWGKVGTWVGRQIGRLWEGFFIGRADMVLTPTPVIADVLRKRYNVAPHLILNCTWFRTTEDLHVHRKIFLSMADRPETKILLYSGGITASQGVSEIIQCLRYFPAKVVLVLLGPMDRNYEKECNEQIEKEQVQDRVFILPPVPPEQVLYYAASAHVGVVACQATSLNSYAVLPNKFFEYIMARIPIAAADFPSMREIIMQEDIGRLYQPSDVQDMARAIREILEPNTYLQLRKNLEQAATIYSWENQAQLLVKLYESTLHGAQSQHG